MLAFRGICVHQSLHSLWLRMRPYPKEDPLAMDMEINFFSFPERRKLVEPRIVLDRDVDQLWR